MIKQEHRFPKNTKVRIKADLTGPDVGMYEYACVGNEGWVRERRMDRYGYPMILVEWDRDHWSYNGEPDKWTFESHFEPVEDNMPEKQSREEMLQAAFAKFVQDNPELLGNDPVETEADDDGNDHDEDLDPYFEGLSEAFDLAAKGDAYIVISIERGELGGKPTLTPSIYSYSLSPEARVLADFVAGQVGFEAFSAISADRVRQIAAESEQGDV